MLLRPLTFLRLLLATPCIVLVGAHESCVILLSLVGFVLCVAIDGKHGLREAHQTTSMMTTKHRHAKKKKTKSRLELEDA